MRLYIQHSTRQRLNILFASAFITHLLLLHVGMPGFVLCVGGDGHIAIERSLDETTCMDTEFAECSENSVEHSEAYCSFDESHCGDCMDIALLSDCNDEKARTPRKIYDSKLDVLFAALAWKSRQENVSKPIVTRVADYVYIPSFTARRNTILLT